MEWLPVIRELCQTMSIFVIGGALFLTAWNFHLQRLTIRHLQTRIENLEKRI
jgi:hypothetical protein